MPLVSLKEMLLKAQKEKYAVPAFNVENMEMLQAVIQAAEDLASPVILQTTPSTIRYGSMGLYASMTSCLAVSSRAPIALHLDHGDSYDICLQAMRAGYSSVMIDGSKLPLTENIKLTSKITEMANALDIPVEGELGLVGGREDSVMSTCPAYTDPDEAAEFVTKTGVFSLAISIGTSHGVYSGTPKLDMERLSAIAGKIPNPLVLHGTSGVPDSDVKECVRRGICKVNYATDLRIAFTNGIKEAMRSHPDAFDPRVYLKAGRKKVYEEARYKLQATSYKLQVVTYAVHAHPSP